MTKFLETVLSLLSKKGVSKNKMLTDLELGKNSFVNWENRGTIPGGNTINKIAEYFEVSTDYLLGNTQTSAENDKKMSTEDIKIMKMIKSLSPEKKEMFLKFLKSL